jgi:hypothetical protein
MIRTVLLCRLVWPLAYLVLAAVVAPTRAEAVPPEIDVLLFFDTEDYLSPADDDATLRLCQLLTARGIHATFKIVGEKARVLEQRGRRDVIAALQRHDIGYLTSTTSGPFPESAGSPPATCPCSTRTWSALRVLPNRMWPN